MTQTITLARKKSRRYDTFSSDHAAYEDLQDRKSDFFPA